MYHSSLFKVVAGLALAVSVVLAGCKPATEQPTNLPSINVSLPVTRSPEPSQSPTAASSHSRPTFHILKVHDPGLVTWTQGQPAPGTCRSRDDGKLPDRQCTPGAIDPAVTQSNIDSTICVSGYTSTVRPPESQTTRAKYDVLYPAYGIPQGTYSELDHLIPLELGGANDGANLWPEVGSIPNPKDSVENRLHRLVCDGAMKLSDAQKAFVTNWERY